MVDKNLMSIDQVVEVNDTDTLYVVQNGTTDGRVDIGQVRGTVVKSLNGDVGDFVIKAGTNVTIDKTVVGEMTINADLKVIRTPEAVSPLTGDTDVSVTTALVGGAYGHLYGVVRQYREFQVDLIGSDFSSPIRSFQVDSDSWAIYPALTDDTEFKWRCRDVDIDGDVSDWSEAQSFKTYDIYIQTPSITSPIEGSEVPEKDGVITSSVFSAVNSTETHVASYWVIKQSGGVVHSSGRVTEQLTSYNVPTGVLVAGGEYTVEVQYEGSEGTLSDYSVPVGFVGGEAPYGKYLAVAHNTSPFITVYGQDVDTFNKLANPTTLPTSTGLGVAFSSDGVYMAVSHNTTPSITIYKREGDVFTKLANPSTLPTGNGLGVAFSSDGVCMAVAHDSTPFITIYKREGDVFTKLADPSTLPTSNGRGVAFSSDGVYMAVAHDSTPFITIYKREGDVFTKLADPSTLPTGVGFGVAFSSDGVYMAVAHSTTPYITIYKRDGDVFTKLANPSTLPTDADRGVAFSSDGVYMAVAQTTTPFIIIYKRDGDVFTKLANPTTLPTGTGLGVAFSSDGVYMAVAHSTTPYITIYKRDGDVFTKLADPSTLPTSNGRGVAFWPKPY